MLLLDLAGPPRCATCGVLGHVLCARCRSELVVCPPLDPLPPLARLSAACLYEGAARSLVLGLKLGALRTRAGPLADAMCASAWRDGIAGNVVTWVPGNPVEARRRGYDHGEVLARLVAARLGMPVTSLLVPAGAKKDQTTLSGAQRRENPKGAFVARTVHGRVVIVDDVMTTGATICACAGALRRAGAEVEGLVGCRA
ncbi:MAG TPA: phosphoribosyltransferase family protein [Actinomycetota bacterium]|nr:phosphoribosyltransferase family protein [Actinomycetota bacterium]